MPARRPRHGADGAESAPPYRLGMLTPRVTQIGRLPSAHGMQAARPASPVARATGRMSAGSAAHASRLSSGVASQVRTVLLSPM
jgi:hypothetical protein